MVISVIHANSSISVMPGSETLCSVHSGHAREIRVRASETRSWKRRSSSSISGSLTRPCLSSRRGSEPPGELPAASQHARGSFALLRRDHVERVDEVALGVDGANLVADVDGQQPAAGLREVERDRLDLDARLPALESDADRVLHAPDRVGVDRVEHEVVHAAAELGSHRTLARSGAQNEHDRLVDVLLVARQGDAAATVDLEGEREPRTDDLRHVPTLSEVDDRALDVHRAGALDV